MKRLFALVLAVLMLGGILCACTPKENITTDEAVKIVMDDLDQLAGKAEPPHVHEGKYNNQPCYNVYVTVGQSSFVYVVSMSGKILYKGLNDGGHSH